MRRPGDMAIVAATGAIIGFYLLQLGVLSLGLVVIKASEANYWGLLFVPIAVPALLLAGMTLRGVAAALTQYR